MKLLTSRFFALALGVAITTAFALLGMPVEASFGVALMAQPANTYSVYSAKGIREDLTDDIFNISPTDTPFMSNLPREKATNTLHEWQTDALAAAVANNAVIEGDDATLDASTATVRLGNYTQILDKTAVVTGTLEVVKKAGRGEEMAYQIAKKSQELKRDIESSLLANQARVVGNDTTARRLAGVPAWIATNDVFGAGGASPTGDGTDARTDGTQVAFTEAMLKAVLLACYTQGGDPTILMVGPANKQVASTFTANSTRFDKTEDEKLYAAIDVYKSDFGTLKIVPNRFMRARDAFVFDMEYWALAMLRPVTTYPLAKTGDTDKNQIITELTLVARQEKASGGIFDLT